MRYTVLVLLAFLMCVANLSATTVALKDNHDVYREFLTLADFFNGIAPEKDQDILEAPNKGENKHYTHAWIQQLAKNFGLSWNPSHNKGITIT